jgi:hypothetical protein
MKKMRTEILGLSVVAIGSLMLLSQPTVAAAGGGDCFYFECPFQCPSQSEWEDFCVEWMIEHECTLQGGGCQPWWFGPCDPMQVYAFCGGDAK